MRKKADVVVQVGHENELTGRLAWTDVDNNVPDFTSVQDAKKWARGNVVGEYRVNKVYTHGTVTIEKVEKRVVKEV